MMENFFMTSKNREFISGKDISKECALERKWSHMLDMRNNKENGFKKIDKSKWIITAENHIKPKNYNVLWD